MKLTLSGLVASALLLTCSGMAQAENNDVAATLNISGQVNARAFNCLVNMDQASISIIENPESLIKQGDNATNPTQIHLSIEGGAQCHDLVTAGKIAYQIVGVADNADGTTLANSLTDAGAATGVGVGIFDADNKPVSVTSGRLTAQEDTVFGLQLVQLNGQQAVAGNIYTTASVQIERL